jgi:hypothetical protein
MNTSENQNRLPYEIEREGSHVQNHYKKMIEDGVGEKFAVMCALQTPPASKGTDRSYMQGRYNNEQFNEMPAWRARKMIREAKAAGINPSGKYYCGPIADKRGVADPEAWVDGHGDIQRVAAKRNLTVQGAVNHKGRAMPRPESKRLSDSATRELMAVEKRKHPTMKQGELKEKVIDKYGRKKK